MANKRGSPPTLKVTQLFVLVILIFVLNPSTPKRSFFEVTYKHTNELQGRGQSSMNGRKIMSKSILDRKNINNLSKILYGGRGGYIKTGRNNLEGGRTYARTIV